MPQYSLILRLHQLEPAEQASWRLSDQDHWSQASLAQAAVVAAGKSVLLLIPGNRLLLTQTRLPKGNPARLLQAVPYVLEEQLCAEVDSLHFALGQRQPSGLMPTVVIERHLVQHLLSHLAGFGLVPQAVMADSQVWNAESGTWRLLLGPEQSLLAMGSEPTRHVDPEDWKVWLQLYLKQADAPPETVEIIDCRDSAEPSPPVIADVELTYRHDPGRLDDYLLHQPEAPMDFSLLQGEFSPGEKWGRLLRPWRPAALLLLLLLGLQLGLNVVENQAARAELQQLDRHIQALFQQALPGARMVNPKVQLERALLQKGQSARADDLALMLNRLGQAGQGGEAQLERLRYRPGELVLEIKATGLDQIEKLRSRLLAEPGWQVSIQSATAGSEGVRGRLLVQREQQ